MSLDWHFLYEKPDFQQTLQYQKTVLFIYAFNDGNFRDFSSKCITF